MLPDTLRLRNFQAKVTARETNDEFSIEYSKAINRFTLEFASQHCDPNGLIIWVELVEFNSEKKDK